MFIYSTNLVSMLRVVHCVRRAAANLSICKGIISAVPDSGSEYIVRLDVPGNPMTVSARLHPEAINTDRFHLQVNSPVFVYKDSAEIVAYGKVDKKDNRIKFVKIACIHPERSKDRNKLCANCPLESKPQTS
jgi:hypothetical protein